MSDLHRTETDPIGNDELISTLVADRDRYTAEDPQIPGPEAVVVSGDLVQGAGPGSVDPDAEVGDQYEVAVDLLARLAERFAEGDRSRVLVVPGNHDVEWHVARQAMTAVDAAAVPKDLSPIAFGPSSDLRWDWRERRLYRIVDHELYEHRFRHYTAAMQSFYAGVRLPFGCDDKAYYRLFELFEGRVGVVGFNSCGGNDCFAFHGHIPQRAVARAHMDLHDRAAGYDLLMAIWHHSIEGAPYTSDYMDVEVVHALIGKGFRLGLHGHQHRAQAASRYIHLPEQEPMAVISAGSLCAGRHDLPTGVNRQYNIVELDDAFTKARVHIREMAVATVFAAARRSELGGRGYVDLSLGGDSERAHAALIARQRPLVDEAEQAISDGRFADALSILAATRPTKESYPRTLLVRALREGRLWDRAGAALAGPLNAAELALLVRANTETGRLDDALSLLGRAPVLGMPEPVAADLRRWVETQREINR
ncbi:MAG: metallophosphoesterase family protein [Candidatus Dormibacteria bacterium]